MCHNFLLVSFCLSNTYGFLVALCPGWYPPFHRRLDAAPACFAFLFSIFKHFSLPPTGLDWLLLEQEVCEKHPVKTALESSPPFGWFFLPVLLLTFLAAHLFPAAPPHLLIHLPCLPALGPAGSSLPPLPPISCLL